jgi:phasin
MQYLLYYIGPIAAGGPQASRKQPYRLMPSITGVATIAGLRHRHKRMITMSDVSESTTTTSRSRTRTSATSVGETPKFEIPRFELPKFEMPKLEVPAAFREFAEKGVTQAKDNWEKMKAATEEATDLMEDSYAAASKGAADYGLKLIEVARANANAVFDYASELLTVKSPSEAVEISTAHMRKQIEAMTAQSKELTTLAQKVATETAEPIKAGVTSAFKKAA